MFTQVTVEATSVEAVLSRAHAATGSASMLAFLSGPMAEALQLRAKERFWSQGEDVSGGGWKAWEPLTEATLQFRAAAGYGPTPINVRSGAMEKFVTESKGAASATGTGASLVWPGAPSNMITQEKINRAQGGDPEVDARHVIGLSDEDLALGLAAMSRWIVMAIGGTP